MLKKIIFISSFIIFGLLTIIIYQKIALDDGKLHLVFCDVGQGDAIFIRTPKGQDLLIDGGPNDRVLNCLGSHMPFWDKTLEMAVLTHPHADHLNGLISVIESYPLMLFIGTTVGEIAQTEGFKQLKNVIANRKIKTIDVQVGDRLRLEDGVSFRVLWPNQNSPVADVNDASIVLMLSYGDFEALLTGDAGVGAGWESEDLDNVDVLKVPHHGSRTGLNDEFLNKARPGLAIISVGKNNRYGHPHQQTIKILRDKDIKILRTDENGEVEIVSDGRTFSIKK